jgi:hypothetical protein
MAKIMAVADPAKPVHSIHHADREYKPNGKGKWSIDDAHVEALRPHGLILESEAEERARAEAAKFASDEDQIASLEGRLKELKAKKKPTRDA